MLHQYSFFVSLAGGLVLVLASSADWRSIASAVYAAALAGLFGVSALYHRIDVAARAGGWMRRLDHAMIFLLIAGTYTPIGAADAAPHRRAWCCWRWCGGRAVAGIVFSLAWITAPRWVAVVLYLRPGLDRGRRRYPICSAT